MNGWRRALAVVLMTVATAAGLAAAWALWTFGSLDPSATPARLRVYGRTYRSQDLAITTGCEDAGGVHVLEPAIGVWPLVMPWDRPPGEDGSTPMQVWLRLGADGCRGYGLSGGP